MWAPYWAHIIGDHLGLDPRMSCSAGKCPLMPCILCTGFPMYVLGSSLRLMSPIAMSCWKMFHEQNRAPTKLHQTYPEIQASSRLELIPSSPASMPSSCAVCRKRSSFVVGWSQCVESPFSSSHSVPLMLSIDSSMI